MSPPAESVTDNETQQEVRRGSLRLRSRIMAGLVLVIPIWLTFVVVTFVFRLMRDASLWLVHGLLASPVGEPILASWGLEEGQFGDQGLEALPLAVQWGISLASVMLTVALIYLLGAITTNVVGRRTVQLAEMVVARVPFVAVVYHASKKVLETLVGDEARPFQRVVLVPFPGAATRSIGFLTHVFRDSAAGHTLYTVFVPTAPNPTTGFVLVLKPSDVVELNWTAEEAIKVIMSGGVLMPDSLPASRAELVSHE